MEPAFLRANIQKLINFVPKVIKQTCVDIIGGRDSVSDAIFHMGCIIMVYPSIKIILTVLRKKFPPKKKVGMHTLGALSDSVVLFICLFLLCR